MRKALVTTAILLCLAAAAAAENRNQDAQPQSKQTEKTQMARNEVYESMDDTATAKCGCVPKAGKRSNPKKSNHEDDPGSDPKASQNEVEYGGAG